MKNKDFEKMSRAGLSIDTERILELLKSGQTIAEISEKLGVKKHVVFSVRDAYRDELPEKYKKIRWSVRVSEKLNCKMLAEIVERGITPTELLNDIIGGWYNGNDHR